MIGDRLNRVLERISLCKSSTLALLVGCLGAIFNISAVLATSIDPNDEWYPPVHQLPKPRNPNALGILIKAINIYTRPEANHDTSRAMARM